MGRPRSESITGGITRFRVIRQGYKHYLTFLYKDSLWITRCSQACYSAKPTNLYTICYHALKTKTAKKYDINRLPNEQISDDGFLDKIYQ